MAMAPTVVAVLIGILVNNSRLSDLRSYMDTRFNEVDRRFTLMDKKFDQRFDDASIRTRGRIDTDL